MTIRADGLQDRLAIAKHIILNTGGRRPIYISIGRAKMLLPEWLMIWVIAIVACLLLSYIGSNYASHVYKRRKLELENRRRIEGF